MPLYQARIVKDEGVNRKHLIQHVEILFLAKSIDDAESAVAGYALYALPGMAIDSLYEVVATVSDATANGE